MTSAADLQLFAATVSGNAKSAEVAIADGADVNSRYAENLTPLHYAARSGDQATVDLLIASGAHANSKNDDGLTPSDLARLGGHHQIAALIEAAAKQQQGHAGRVTALTTARQLGSHIIELRDFAGHADPRTTLTYIRNRDQLDESPAYMLKY